jgi:hypothetical protein
MSLLPRLPTDPASPGARLQANPARRAVWLHEGAKAEWSSRLPVEQRHVQPDQLQGRQPVELLAQPPGRQRVELFLRQPVEQFVQSFLRQPA